MELERHTRADDLIYFFHYPVWGGYEMQSLCEHPTTLYLRVIILNTDYFLDCDVSLTFIAGLDIQRRRREECFWYFR